MKRTIKYGIVIMIVLGLLTSCDNGNKLKGSTSEESVDADINTYSNTLENFNWFALHSDRSGNIERKAMTLDDVRELSAKGNDLLFEDLLHYQGGNVSSNLNSYIMIYSVEGGYRLVVHSNASGKPHAVNLESVWESGGSGIDIRYGDVEAFLQSTPSQRVITEQEALDLAQPYSGVTLEPVNWEVLGNEPISNRQEAIYADNLLNSLYSLSEPSYLFQANKSTFIYISSYGPCFAVGKKTGTVYYGVPASDGKIDNWYIAEARGINALDDAMTWYLNEILAQRFMGGVHFAASYRILNTISLSDHTTIYAQLLWDSVTSSGRTVFGGAGVFEITFQINNNVYEFVESRDVDKGHEDFGKYTISESLFAEMRAEVDKNIADFFE